MKSVENPQVVHRCAQLQFHNMDNYEPVFIRCYEQHGTRQWYLEQTIFDEKNRHVIENRTLAQINTCPFCMRNLLTIRK